MVHRYSSNIHALLLRRGEPFPNKNICPYYVCTWKFLWLCVCVSVCMCVPVSVSVCLEILFMITEILEGIWMYVRGNSE